MNLRTIKMPDELWKALQREAAHLTIERDKQVSVSQVVREVCAAFTIRQESKRAKSK